MFKNGMHIGLVKKNRRVQWSLALLALFLVTAFQNCGDVRLTELQVEQSSVTVNGRDGSKVPVPEQLPGDYRIVILLDQSFSMVWNKCETDLDGVNPLPQNSTFSSCVREPGVDANGHRYRIVEAWLDEIQALSQEDSDIKIAIIPFSGGKAKRPGVRHRRIHGLRDTDYMQFLPIAEAREWINALEEEQDEMIRDGSQEYMGTTVFSPALQYAYGIVNNELDSLKELDKLSTTPFRIVFMSDGVYKPIQVLRDRVMDVAGCPNCNEEPDHLACTCFSPRCFSGVGTSPGQYCRSLLDNFDTSFGNVENNRLPVVKDHFNSFFNLKENPEYRGLQLDMRFATINWGNVPTEDKNIANDDTHNVFEEIFAQLNEFVPLYNINSPEPPFSIIGGGQDSLTYIIKNFYVINQNVFVDKYGELVTDSDGDGLSDEFEMANQLDPQKARTNDICLDYIAYNYNCQTIGCNPTIDTDGDGLNQCEEATLGTLEVVDTDTDNILDIFETLRGLNPKVDQSNSYSSGDNYSDHVHFRKGVDIGVQLSQVHESHKVHVQVRLDGFDTERDGNGNINAVAKYVIDVNSIPVRPVLASHGAVSMEYGGATGIPIPDHLRMDPLDHRENMNQITFLMQLSTKENPNKIYWYMLKQEVDGSIPTGTITLPLDLELSKFVQIKGAQ